MQRQGTARPGRAGGAWQVLEWQGVVRQGGRGVAGVGVARRGTARPALLARKKLRKERTKQMINRDTAKDQIKNAERLARTTGEQLTVFLAAAVAYAVFDAADAVREAAAALRRTDVPGPREP